MPEKIKHSSAQLGTYVTMIVGLLFLFLVVSQAGKYQKDGSVVTSAKERNALLTERQKTLLKIGAEPVNLRQNPLSGMPGADGRFVQTMQTGQAIAHPIQQSPLTPRRDKLEDTASMQRTLERTLDHVRRTTQEARPEQTSQQATKTNPTPEPKQSDTVQTTVSESQKRQYTIRPNETLFSIALKVYGNGNRWRDILKANPGLNPNRMSQGTKLNIPAPEQPSAAYRRWATGNEG